MAVHTILNIQPIVAELAQKYGAQRICLFGSHARGDMNETGDVDLRIDKGQIKGLELASLLLDLEDALESVLKPSKRRLEAPFSARTALIGLEIRQDSCVQSPCLTKKSTPIRHSASFKTDSRAVSGFNSYRKLR